MIILNLLYKNMQQFILNSQITMAKYSFIHISYFCFIFSVVLGFFCIASADVSDEERRVHIVYMGSLVEGTYETTSIHHKMLQQIIGQSSVADVLTRSYKRSFSGFAAKLTDQEARKLSRMEGVVSVFPSRTYQLHTTRSWDFLGFSTKAKHIPAIESNIIIGVIDSGIWPESESFSDKGFGPPPKKWKGACAGGKNFTCNNKVIGARDYTNSSARDEQGHGTHTASTAAGNLVDGVSFFGMAKGLARGGVPSARLAAYKVCNHDGCNGDAILAAYDDAIADGVDILSVSLGFRLPLDLNEDVMAIGAFHAMAKGILSVNSAGNNGEAGPYQTISISPWSLSVAASSIDRQFIDRILLGNGKTLTGASINSFSLNGTKFPLVHGKDISKSHCVSTRELRSCSCVLETKVKGKILICDRDVMFSALPFLPALSAVGIITQYPDGVDTPFPQIVPVPATALSDDNYTYVKSYKNSTKNPVAEILRSETIKNSTAPVVAYFSSLGPNTYVRDILKPDLTAPGISILAAYSPVSSPEEIVDTRRTSYSIFSGTSMSCPHVSGVAAYVKTFHPDWSPSAIKSALMTTASPMNPKLHTYGHFAYGSGQVNPLKAIDPGLVYDASAADYIKLLCTAFNSSLKSVRQITGDKSTCPEKSKNVPVRDLNYPSLTSQIPANKSFTISFSRTVTNVGNANSTYKAEISNNSKLNITIEPAVLSFKTVNESLSFKVTVSATLVDEKFVFAGLLWSDGIHEVRSPIVIYTDRFHTIPPQEHAQFQT